jgi:hypothetical protein
MKKAPLYKRTSLSATAIASTAICLALGAMRVQADWPNSNATKYVQLPDTSRLGYNVLAAQPPAGSGIGLPLILADDFPCNQTGPITDIHIWASWLGDSTAANIPDIPITLSIWSDVPAFTNADGRLVPSHPGQQLWSETFFPGGAIQGHYELRPWPPMPWTTQQFWCPDPFPAGVVLGPDHVVWQYNFYPASTDTFVQQGSPGNVVMYWLSVAAGTETEAFGWMTAATNAFDNAVYGHLDTNGVPIGDWSELIAPQTGRSLDLAFALTTTNPATPPPPPPTGTPSKYVQYPNLSNGLDVNGTSADQTLTLADDFPCRVAGPITNIQLWGSWLNDVTPAPSTFEVSIWSDSPPTPANTTFSQPYQRLWHQTYNPGDYSFSYYTNGTEEFFDEYTGLLSPETNVWLYSFDVPAANPFCQQGPGHTYWVSVAVQQIPGAVLEWGWKSSTNHWGDIAVYGKVDPVTGSLLGAWQPLYNPAAPAPEPLEFAFRINGGPPSPDCDPNMNGADVQRPDTSTNGMDVWAVAPTQVGDDFLCRISGQISGFTVWGSWLNDLVDTNAIFEVNLWSDVPALPANSPFSHPGELLCSAVFQPPQTVGTSVLRYQDRLYAANLQESFFNPNLPATVGPIIGTDTQIWRYDFFPFVPSCFIQRGSPFNRGLTYWMTLSYLGGNPNDTNTYVFGWKTSTNHWGDAAVFGHGTNDWEPMVDPRNGSKLDLSRVIWKFPVTGINKDMVNLTSVAADGIQLVLSGPHLITWHYDNSPPWNKFLATNDTAGNTVLEWYGGPPVLPGATNHIGFETPGTVVPTILAMNWLSGTNIIAPAPQVNFHFLGDSIIFVHNDFYPGVLTVANASLELYTNPPPLDQLNPNGQRNPMAVIPLETPQSALMPGDGSVIAGPAAFLPAVQYAVIIAVLKDANGRLGATDFVLLPLDAALTPSLTGVGVVGGQVMIHIGSLVGRTYQLQSANALGGSNSWVNVGLPVSALGGDTMFTVPAVQTQGFYRVLLMP